MNKAKLILTINSIHSICGGAIKVIGNKEQISQIGQNVKLVGSTNSFYASVIDFNIKKNSVELSLENFGNNIFEIGMDIFEIE